MAKPYSLDLRERVVEAVEAGATRQAAGDRFGVSDSSAIRWVQRTGEFAAKRRGGSNSPLEKHAAVLLALVTEQPDLTLDEWCAMLREREMRFRSGCAEPSYFRPWIFPGTVSPIHCHRRSASGRDTIPAVVC
jgi:transposase